MTTPTHSHDVLVVTLPPFEGGVPAKTRILCEHLRTRGHRVRVAWYATFAHHSELNVPAWMLGRRNPGIAEEACFGDFPAAAIGCRLPELEAPYYQPSPRWRALIAAHDRHIAVGGSPMVSHLLAADDVPHLLWCASDVMADRRDRQARMGLLRGTVDALITRPRLRAQQRLLVERCPMILGVSSYTVRQLRAEGADPARLRRLPIPTDSTLFHPPETPAETGTIGFAARFEDPRKNIGLLLEAAARLHRRGMPVRLRLAGAEPSAATRAKVAALGIGDRVDFPGELPRAALPDFYRSLDVMAIPSHQEGLCISGIEAMACGVPVVSTRCGGPEDYVRPDRTGLLCAAEPEAVADALARVIGDRALRQRLSQEARRTVTAEYDHGAFAAGLADAWQAVWGDRP